MAKIIDRLLLFIYSLSIGVISIAAIFLLSGTNIGFNLGYQEEYNLQIVGYVIAGVLLLISLRFFYISIRRDKSSTPSIDQRTEHGDIQISMDTIENLCLKAAAKHRGVSDLKARIRVVESGLDITLRAVVDGDMSIPALTSDIQKGVHDHVEEITGIPVSGVSVYIANVTASPSFKSRVE